jgi:hypothetical protein
MRLSIIMTQKYGVLSVERRKALESKTQRHLRPSHDAKCATSCLNMPKGGLSLSVVIFALMKYRRVIESLTSRSKVKFDFAGVSIETTLETLERSVEESLRGNKLSREQWAWLKRLRDEGRIATEPSASHVAFLRPKIAWGAIREPALHAATTSGSHVWLIILIFLRHTNTMTESTLP